MCAKHRGKVQDRERAKLISKREAARRFNEQLNDFINTINGMTTQ